MKRKNMIVTCIVAIATFIVGYFIGDASAINRVNKSISTAVQESAPAAKQDNSSQKKSIIYKFADEGKSGNWDIKVLDSHEATTIQSGDGSNNKTTQQKFIIVKLQMKNVSQSPLQCSENEFMLGNSKDKKEYQMDTEAALTASQVETIYKNNNNFFLMVDNLNPDTPKQTYLVFEVPTSFNIADGILINSNAGADAVGYNLK